MLKGPSAVANGATESLVARTKRRVPGIRLLVIATLTCAAALLVGVASGLGATSTTPYEVERLDTPDPQPGARWAERLVVAGDIDGDGVNDFFLSDYGLDVNGLEEAGRVYLFSGRTRAVLMRIDSPEPQANARFGFFISAFGDAGGDGKPDVAVGTSTQDVGGTKDVGKVWVFSSADGRVLFEIDHPRPQPNGGFGRRIGRAGNVAGNGVPEIIVGAPGQDIPAGCSEDGTVEAGCFETIGQAYIFDGATGEFVRTLNIPEEDRITSPPGDRCVFFAGGQLVEGCGWFGQSVQGPGDSDGDGVTDQLVGAINYGGPGDKWGGHGRLYLFSGRTGEVLQKIDPPDPQPDQLFGFQDVAPLAPGDVNGDGLADLYGGAYETDGPAGENQGRAWVLDGRTGHAIYQLDDPTPSAGGNFGWSLDRTDFNKDGVPDQYIGQAPHGTPGANEEGGTYVFDGRDSSVLKALELPASVDQPGGAGNGGARLGWAVAAPGDLNGDCEPDYLGGAPWTDVNGNQDQGAVFSFLSSGPSACPAAVPPPVPPVPSVSTCGDPAAAGYLHPAKLRVSRARVLRSDRRLDVLAPITSRAEGDVAVTFQADNRQDTFDEDVSEANTVLDVIRISKEITRGQAELGTGIVNIHYLGDEDTREQFVRLRAASQRAELDVDKISLIGDRLSAAGSLTDKAEGRVRFRYSYLDPDGMPNVHEARAEIGKNGAWKLNNDQVPAQLAQCGGYLSIQFTGYFPRRIRGEQLAYQLNPGQTRTP